MDKKVTLWNIADELHAIEEDIQLNSGEINEAQEVALGQLSEMLTTKTESCIDYIDHVESMVVIAKKKKEEISNYIKSSEKRLANFKSFIIMCMDKMKTDKVSTDLIEMKIRKPTKVVHIFNEEAIPPQFTTVETTLKISKAELKKALKSGEVDGAELRDSPNRSLNIKMKR